MRELQIDFASELEDLQAKAEKARIKANKASNRAWWWTSIALWVNLMNVGFQIGLIIGKHAH